MSAFALTLLLIAAFVHIIPHAAIKGAGDRTAFVWWMLLVNGVVYAPVAILAHPFPPKAWEYIILSGLTETLYLLAISRAYHGGELSMAYPLARGSAPLFLLISSALLLHEPISRSGAAGILLIAAGVYLINLTSLGDWLEPLRALRHPSPRWAVVAGMFTATYTTIDKLGVQLAPPLIYIYLALVTTFVAYTPLTLIACGWPSMRATLRASPWRVVIAGAAMPLAYALVLVAMRLGTFASYAGSVREVSVIVAAFAGVIFFGEKLSVARVAGAVVIVSGVVLIAMHR